MRPELGLTETQQEGVINALNTVLADQHVLYTKLRNYHWNIIGAEFFALHELFEKQYNAVKESADVVAERVRAHGGNAIGTLEEFLERTRLKEKPNDYPGAQQMVINLVKDHEVMVRNLRKDAERCGEEYDDAATEDLFIGLLQDHEEMAWMLRSFVEGQPIKGKK